MTAANRRTRSNPFWPRNFPDPFLVKVRGRYYAYATEREERPAAGSMIFPVLTSSDLVEWQEAGSALPALGAPYFRYWAPELTAYNGQFYLYYAVHTAEFAAGIRVALAEDPRGPFVDSGRDLTSALFPWAIDPHVFRDDDGQWYLYMTIEYWDDPAGLTGSGNAVVRLRDLLTPEGGPARVTPPRHRWELFEARRAARGGVDWYTVEGPAVVKHRGRYYEMFSGGCYYRDNYAVSYATSDVPMGPGGMHDESWRDWEPPGGDGRLMQGEPDQVIGPGHNSLVFGPNNVDLYMAYHAWPREMTVRRPCLDRLYWHGDRLWTPAPTRLPQPAPALPRFRDLFDTPELRPEWRPGGGAWTVMEGAVRQQDGASVHAVLDCEEQLGSPWLLEVNLRHLSGDGSYGVLLYDSTGVAGTLVTIHAAAQTLSVRSPRLVTGDDTGVALPGGCLSGAWRQLLITRAGAILTMRLDGLSLLAVRCPDVSGHFSLITTGASAAFAGISVTDCFRDEFLDTRWELPDLGWFVPQTSVAMETGSFAHWRLRDGALEQAHAGPGGHLLLKGRAQRHYEFGATVALRGDQEGDRPAYGLVAWRNDRLLYAVLLAWTGAAWALAVDGDSVESPAKNGIALPASFDPDAWHTMRLERRGHTVTVTIDGPEVTSVIVPPGVEILGLLTRDTAAAFTDVWQTTLEG